VTSSGRVFYEKYSLRDPDGQPTERTPQEMWDRVARGLAEMEREPERRAHWQREFRWLLDTFRFLPGGRILHAVGQAGVGRKAVPANCFVLPIRDDTLAGIYDCAKEVAITYSRGGSAARILRRSGLVARSFTRRRTRSPGRPRS